MRIILIIILAAIIIVVSLPTIFMMQQNGNLPFFLQNNILAPAPWVIPKKEGESALSLAMVHDVIHERFYFHGPAWYEHRHSNTKQLLNKYQAADSKKDDVYYALVDDYAVECDRLGKPSDGIPLLREKFAHLNNRPNSERSNPDLVLYTTYANLGTLLVHAHMKDAIAKNDDALEKVKEGLSYIEKAVVINPNAHFGREKWQVIAIRYLLEACKDQTILTSYDMFGNNWEEVSHKYISERGIPRKLLHELNTTNDLDRLKKGPRSEEDRQLVEIIRNSIPHSRNLSSTWRQVCYLPDATELDKNISRNHIPFDEPTLAFVGIWTLGGGANPHLSLALAHTMEGLNQWMIAWNAYERTCELAEKYWPDKEIQNKLINHCRIQQGKMESLIKTPADKLRLQYQKELSFGKSEKLAYQTYEADKIAAGINHKETNFYGEFLKNRPAITSDPGFADTVVIRQHNVWGWILLIQSVVCTFILFKLIPHIIRRHQKLAQLKP